MKPQEVLQVQELIIRGAANLPSCTGDETERERMCLAVELIGQAWDGDPAATRRCIERLQGAVKESAERPAVLRPEEAAQALWGCFQAAVQLERRADRLALYQTAQRLALVEKVYGGVKQIAISIP